MGQCASTLPPGEPKGMEDGLSIATAQSDADLPWQTQLWMAAKQTRAAGKLGSSGLADRHEANLNRDFLKIHTPDRHAKCILDPHEVAVALEYQADELLRKDNAKHDGLPENDIVEVGTASHLPSGPSGTRMYRRNSISITSYHNRGSGKSREDDDDDVLSRTGAASTITDLNSSVAMSVQTTESTATRLISNIDKYRGRRRRNEQFSQLETLDERSRGSRDDSITDKESVHHSNQARHFGLPRTTSNSSVDSWISRRASHQPRNQFQMYADVMTSCFSSDTTEMRKEQYKSVLHLKMKAHLFDYYQGRFLPTFPEAVVPPGLSRLHSESPKLAYSSDASSASSASSSSSTAPDEQIDFGVGPPSTPVRFLADSSAFMDLSVTGSLGMVPRKRPSTARRKMHGNRKSPDHYIVLMNRRSGIPLAVCARRAAPGPPVVRIYATKPRVFGQRPAATTSELGLDWTDSSLPLYAFAEIVTEGAFPNPIDFSMFLASGSDGRFAAQPSYKATFLANGSPDIKVVGHTDKERVDCGCVLISLKAETSNRDREEASFQLAIAKGIDPALFICFTAVVDEILEQSMRSQVKRRDKLLL